MIKATHKDSVAKVHFSSSEKIDLKDESVQLVVTSPPYFVDKNYGEEKDNLENSDSYEKYKKKLFSIFSECFRVLKPDGKLCINITNPYAEKDKYGRFKRLALQQELVVYLEELGLDYIETIRWMNERYGNSGAILGSYPYPTNLMFNGNYEDILVFRKWVTQDYFSKRELPEKKVKEKSKITKKQWREWTNPLWKIESKQNKDHPAEYPYEIPYRFIRLFTFVGDKVLDPFCGTGTTLEAALKTNRDAEGYEIEKTYKDTILDKIDIN